MDGRWRWSRPTGFLCVNMSSDLRFRDHIEGLIQKGRKRVNILKCMAGKDWGQTMETQRRLYTGYVRSSLEYAAPGWYPWISDTAKEKLDRVQNQSLRSMSRLAMTCPVDFLRLETTVEPLKERMEKQSLILWDKYSRKNVDDGRRQLVERNTVPRLKDKAGLANTRPCRLTPNTEISGKQNPKV